MTNYLPWWDLAARAGVDEPLVLARMGMFAICCDCGQDPLMVNPNSYLPCWDRANNNIRYCRSIGTPQNAVAGGQLFAVTGPRVLAVFSHLP